MESRKKGNIFDSLVDLVEDTASSDDMEVNTERTDSLEMLPSQLRNSRRFSKLVEGHKVVQVEK